MGLDENLDILGQLPFLQFYTQITHCYPIDDASSHSAIVDTLTNGLERLYKSFPWLAGQVVNEDASDGSTGIFKIKPLANAPPLVVKDLRHDSSVPTMDDLRQANFPFSMLDESIIAPRKTHPGSPEESALDSMPVFLVQATFITGGLLLTFLGHHGAMDMTGQGQTMSLFSKACLNEPFTSEELSTGNPDRRSAIPLLEGSFERPPELAHQIARSTATKSIDASIDAHSAPAAVKSTWAYFTFDPASLVALKSLAAKTIPPRSGYISTDDALSAFIWKSVIRARLPRLDPAAESTFARAVDVRRYLNLPKTYPGLMHNIAYHTYPLQKLVDEPLGVLASQFRAAVDPKTSTLTHNTRVLATVLERTPDKSIVSFMANSDASNDFMLSSWAQVNCYDLDFGLGVGKPEAVRKPRFSPVESLAFLMPKRLDGEIALGICLRDEDLKRLRADEEFVKYGRYVG